MWDNQLLNWVETLPFIRRAQVLERLYYALPLNVWCSTYHLFDRSMYISFYIDTWLMLCLSLYATHDATMSHACVTCHIVIQRSVWLSLYLCLCPCCGNPCHCNQGSHEQSYCIGGATHMSLTCMHIYVLYACCIMLHAMFMHMLHQWGSQLIILTLTWYYYLPKSHTWLVCVTLTSPCTCHTSSTMPLHTYAFIVHKCLSHLAFTCTMHNHARYIHPCNVDIPQAEGHYVCTHANLI